MADYGHISSVVAEAATTVPSNEVLGRVSSVVAEVAITAPSNEALGRVSSVVAEAVVTESVDVLQVFLVFVEVFSQSPAAPPQRPAISGSFQGVRVSSLH